VRRDGVGEDGRAQEYALLDRAGRVQLPAEYVDALGLKERVRLGLEPGQITVRADRDDDQESAS
jgi:bifunctional DNA-binding transcriptional regulator/antitoxin component of YhaV-PrlF toxin-antitoxin module